MKQPEDNKTIDMFDEPPVVTRRQQHTAWLCAGTNRENVVPTWFYTFRTAQKANQFVVMTQKHAPHIWWEIYPCPLDEVDDAMAAFVCALDAVERLPQE